jgi:hypothetical protein
VEKEMKLRADDCLLEKKRNKNLRNVLADWINDPRTLGISQISFTQLFQGLHDNPHIFAEGQLKNVWKTGSGATRVPAKMSKNILFRNLLDYRFEKDDFAPRAQTVSSPAVNKNQRSNVIPDDVSASAIIVDHSWIDEEDSEIESSSDDGSFSSGAEADDDSNDSDYNGDGGQIKVCEIDKHGVEAQIKDDAENNRAIQEMAYFGIEKVLLGENPGIFGYDGYTNALRVIALSNPNALSDRIVRDLFVGLPIEPVSCSRGRLIQKFVLNDTHCTDGNVFVCSRSRLKHDFSVTYWLYSAPFINMLVVSRFFLSHHWGIGNPSHFLTLTFLLMALLYLIIQCTLLASRYSVSFTIPFEICLCNASTLLFIFQ